MARLDQLPTELLDRVLDLVSSPDSPTRQNDLASLVLTNRRLCLLGTGALYDRPVLKDAKRIARYLTTNLGWINPWSRSKREKREIVKPTSISFDYSSPGGGKPCQVPSLKFFLKLGYFDNLTSLHFHNYLDTEHFIPHLLAPHSPLRQQLVDFRLTSSKLPQKIDEVTLSFLLEPCIYADFECFTDCHILPSNRVIPNSHTWLWPTEREPDFYAAAADEPSEPAPPSLIERSHTDFDVFCSIFDYPLCDLPDHPRNPSYICPVISTSSTFSSLSSLEIAIGTNFNLVLLFSGPTLSNLKNLVLAGGSKDTTIPITNYEIMLLRRSISCRTRLRGYNHWPPLIGSTLAGFGEYMGPRLERLDLRKLVLKLCD